MADHTPWDRAGCKEAWAELDAFIKRCEAHGPARTDDDRTRLQREFLEIMERCDARALAIFERAISGEAAPHLHLVSSDGRRRGD